MATPKDVKPGDWPAENILLQNSIFLFSG